MSLVDKPESETPGVHQYAKLFKEEGFLDYGESLNGLRLGQNVSFALHGVSATEGRIIRFIGVGPPEQRKDFVIIGITENRHVRVPTQDVTPLDGTEEKVDDA